MVEWSGPAKRDLKQIHDYIAHNCKYYAKKVSHDIVDRRDMSCSGASDQVTQGNSGTRGGDPEILTYCIPIVGRRECHVNQE